MTNQHSTGDRRFVIVGGYGHVGRHLTALLAPRHDVVVAGRRGDAAAAVATELGCTGATVDAHSGAGLEAVVRPGDVVVNVSSDQPDAALLQATTELGGDYADLSADAPTIAAMLDRHDWLRDQRRRALVGVGLSPGATNVMARAALNTRPEATLVDTVVVLSIADDYGPSAVEWTLRSINPPEPMARHDRLISVQPFGAERQLDIAGIGTVLAYEFPFPEQYFLPDTLGIPHSTSWCALHPRRAGRTVAALARRPRIRRLITHPSVKDRLVRLSSHIPRPARPGIVGAAAIASDDAGTTIVSLASRSESQTTARCAAALLEDWPSGPEAHGVHLPESLIPPDPFLRQLAADGMRIETRNHARQSTPR